MFVDSSNYDASLVKFQSIKAQPLIESDDGHQ